VLRHEVAVLRRRPAAGVARGQQRPGSCGTFWPHGSLTPPSAPTLPRTHLAWPSTPVALAAGGIIHGGQAPVEF